MAEYYFMNQKLVTLDDLVSLGKDESDAILDPIMLLRGTKLDPEPTYINIYQSETSGDFFPDMFNVLLTLFSSKIKNSLDELGIDNIDYYPVNIIDPKTNARNTDYFLANIRTRLRCLDMEKSNVKAGPANSIEIESFQIDESKTQGAELFRLDEEGTLIILHERIYQALEKLQLQGVVLKNTREFDGYGTG